jgi:hypothetical protein
LNAQGAIRFDSIQNVPQPINRRTIRLILVGEDAIYGTEQKAKGGVVAPFQHRSDLWRTHNGPEGLDGLVIGKVFRRRQIRAQDTLSFPQNSFD